MPRPNGFATALFLFGLAATGLTLHGETPAALARYAAYGVLTSLIVSLAAEFRHSWNNLLRADLVALVALYFLLFFEFLFPQKLLNELISIQETELGVIASLCALGAIAAGRHLVPVHSIRRWRIAEFTAPPKTMLWLFWGCFGLGYLHMLIAVDFNPIELVDQFMAPRFWQSWGRGQLGDWKAMLYETGAVLYLVPSLAGIFLGRKNHYTRTQVAFVMAGLVFTLFYGFSSGTRNVIASYLIMFLVSLFYASGAKPTKAVVLWSGLAAGIFLASVTYGLDFREIGLKNYLKGERSPGRETERNMFVDYNLFVVSRLTTIFPKERDYLGLTVPAWVIERPIPRVLWPGKPDGTAISLEGALGEEGLTLSSTFVGEAYMGGGLFGVVLAGLVVGFLAQWWTSKAHSLKSDFGILIYASGFFSIVISMRSIYLLFVAILPVVAVSLVGLWLMSHQTVGHPGGQHAPKRLRSRKRQARSTATN